MKPSYYNFFYPYGENGEKYIAYNSSSGALAFVHSDQFHEYELFAQNNSHELNEKFVKELQMGGFVVENDVDELALLRYRISKAQYSTSVLGITIAPTSDCNFRCVYCYEKEVLRNEIMSEETQDAIIKYVESQAPAISHFAVNWYGGEPLMQIGIIERLSKHFIELAEKYHIKYSASIVTNGSLLTREYAERLKASRVTFCQVTIDGTPNTHNARRPFASGLGTYNTIMQNLFDLGDTIPRVAVRVNTDKTNTDSFRYIQKIFAEKGMKNICVYPAAVTNGNGCFNESACFTLMEFLNYEYETLKEVGDSSYLTSKYPMPKSNACCADSVGGFVIDADGNLYKCWSDIGCSEMSFGNIKTGISRPMNEIVYLSKTLSDEKCQACKLLPICMEGCPYVKRTSSDNRCTLDEAILSKYLIDIAEIVSNNRLA